MLCPRQDAAHGEGQKGVRCRGVRGEEGYGSSIVVRYIQPSTTFKKDGK